MQFLELIEGIARIANLIPEQAIQERQSDSQRSQLLFKIEHALKMINSGIFNNKFDVDYKEVETSDDEDEFK